MTTIPEVPSVDDGAAQRSSVQLVAYGILGAIFVLYAIGWAISLAGTSDPDATGLDAIMRSLGVGVAIAAGPLWFAAAFLVTRKSRLVVKLLWLVLGVVLLVPWPFVTGAGV
jgi:hypothetical protein